MRLRERRHEPAQQNPQPAQTETVPAGSSGSMLEQGEALLDAGNRAIERALSGNSEAFLRATRQHGGE